MTSGADAASAVVVTSLQQELDHVWPDSERAMPTTTAVLAVVAGLVAAVVLPQAPPGLGVVVVGVLIGSAAIPTARRRAGIHELTLAALAIALLTMVALYTAEWFVSMCLLGAVATASYALSRGRTMLGILLGAMSVPLASVRGLPWMARGLKPLVAKENGIANIVAVSRAAATTVLAVLVFGALFASADAAFAALLPDWDFATLPLRLVVWGVVAGLALSAAFLGAAPPRWDVLVPARRHSVRPLEWIAPVAALNVMFATFVGVQLTVLFGGHDHVLRTAGLTYAEYARRGFGQLVVVTLLTLGLVAAVGRWAPRVTRRDRLTLRLLLGALCLLSMVIVASALYRLHLYEEAFGFTRLRLFMNAFETWLGVVLALVVVAGIRLDASWVPRGIVVTASVALLALATVNPDGFVASRNVDRFLVTDKLDIHYLQNLSPDAVPAVDRLPEPLRSCVLRPIVESVDPGGLAAWNLRRDRAREVLERRPLQPDAACPVPDDPASRS